MSTDGKMLISSNNLLNEEQNLQYIHYAEHQFFGLWCYWKYIRENPKEEEDVKLYVRTIDINTFDDSREDYGMTKVHSRTLEEILRAPKPLGEFDENELHTACWELYEGLGLHKPLGPLHENTSNYTDGSVSSDNINQEVNSMMLRNYMKATGMVRINLMPFPYVEGDPNDRNELNMEAWKPLSDLQIKFFFDFIEKYNISSHRIYIDEESPVSEIVRSQLNV